MSLKVDKYTWIFISKTQKRENDGYIIRVLKRNRTIRIYMGIYKRIFAIAMVYAVVEARKFQNLLSASWKTRKSNEVSQPNSEGLRNAGERELLLQVPEFKDLRKRAREDGSLSSRRERGDSRFLCFLFYPHLQRIKWLSHTGKGRSSWLSLLIQTLISSGNILTDILRYNFHQLYRHTLAQSSFHIKINHHNGEQERRHEIITEKYMNPRWTMILPD